MSGIVRSEAVEWKTSGRPVLVLPARGRLVPCLLASAHHTQGRVKGECASIRRTFVPLTPGDLHAHQPASPPLETRPLARPDHGRVRPHLPDPGAVAPD